MVTKRPAASKHHASKRLKKDPNEASEAVQCLIADKLFGCADVVPVIFSFLGPRQLLSFVCVSKDFKSLLTYDHVVRATMLVGGNPATSLERIVTVIRSRKIWIPSPLRLLRTVCGKLCEICSAKNRLVRTSFGVCYCSKCLEQNTVGERWTRYIQAPRVCLGPIAGPGRPHSYLIATPLSARNGERVGPLVTAQDIEIMTQDPDSTPVEKVEALLQKCDSHQPKAESAMKAILKALEDNGQDAGLAEKRRVAIRKQKEFGGARRQRIDEVMASLIQLVKHDSQLIAELNTRTWSTREKQYTFKECRIIEMLLTPVLRTPSKYKSKKKLQEIANELLKETTEKRLVDLRIKQIVDQCGLSDADSKLLKRTHEGKNPPLCCDQVVRRFSYTFHNPAVAAILEGPLAKPRDLTDGDVQRLVIQIKQIARRREAGEAMLKELEKRLEGTSLVDDLGKRSWDTWSWSFDFEQLYVQETLEGPIASTTDIDDRQLEELERQLRSVMEKKKTINARMDLLLERICKFYPPTSWRELWWSWSSKTNSCKLFFCGCVPHTELKNVDQLDDTEMRKISQKLVCEIRYIEMRSWTYASSFSKLM